LCIAYVLGAAAETRRIRIGNTDAVEGIH
jgi:hypothetical protein